MWNYMHIIHYINVWSIGGIQELIFNLFKYDEKNVHSGIGNIGNFSPIMAKSGFIRYDDVPLNTPIDAVVGHTVGGWSNDGLFKWARSRGAKTVECMHSVAHSPTSPNLVDGFIGMSKLATEANPQMGNRTTIYGIANGTVYRSHHLPRWGKIGRLSRVVKEKAPEVFCRASTLMLDEPFVLGGEGEMLPFLKSNFQNSNLEFRGLIRDFQDFYDGLQLCLFPTRDECCCMSVAMAQMAGVPCVVQDIPALRETTGGFASFANGAEDFVEKAKDLLSNLWTYDHLSKNGATWATDHFSHLLVTNKWSEYVHSL
jgi:glycosyltransferase involved in cell wall biosynthesis